MFRVVMLPIIASLTLLCTGCGKAGPTIVEVEGVVTLDDKPLDQIEVQFIPLQEGVQSIAITDDKGYFVLRSLDGEKIGTSTGTHRVTLKDRTTTKNVFMGRAGENVDMRTGTQSRISDQHASQLHSTLTVNVTGTQKDLKIEAEPFNGTFVPPKSAASPASDAAPTAAPVESKE